MKHFTLFWEAKAWILTALVQIHHKFCWLAESNSSRNAGVNSKNPRVSMQNVWCLVLEMSSGSQSLSLPWFPAPSGPAGAMPWIWYNYAFLRCYLFLWWGIGIFWLNPCVSANAAWGGSRGKKPCEFLIYLKYLVHLYLHELRYSSFKEDNM